MCLPGEELENDYGLVQIYRQMMPADLFQAQYGGWLSNLHIKSPMGFGIIMLIAAISCGIYFAYLNWQGTVTDNDKIKKPRKKLTAQRTKNKNNIGSKAKEARAESSADASRESESNSVTTKKSGLKRSAKKS